MARNRYAAKPPLYGMVLVFCAIALVAVTAYLHAGWWSLVGYAQCRAVRGGVWLSTVEDFDGDGGGWVVGAVDGAFGAVFGDGAFDHSWA